MGTSASIICANQLHGVPDRPLASLGCGPASESAPRHRLDSILGPRAGGPVDPYVLRLLHVPPQEAFALPPRPASTSLSSCCVGEASSNHQDDAACHPGMRLKHRAQPAPDQL